MEKVLFIDKNARKELAKFSKRVQEEFDSYFDTLSEKGKLEFPNARKLTRKLFEVRIKLEGEYRGFYAYVRTTHIVVLHIFRKKTQKTPLQDIRLAEKRLQVYEKEKYIL